MSGEIVGDVSDVKNCHITLRNIQEKHFGTWKCKIVHSLSNQFQEAQLTVTPSGKSFDVRLPSHLSPQRYQLFLTPFIKEGNFTIPGHVDIVIHVLESQSKNITIHSEKIDIYENLVKIAKDGNEQVPVEGFGYDEERNLFILYLSEKEPPYNQYQV